MGIDYSGELARLNSIPDYFAPLDYDVFIERYSEEMSEILLHIHEDDLTEENIEQMKQEMYQDYLETWYEVQQEIIKKLNLSRH